MLSSPLSQDVQGGSRSSAWEIKNLGRSIQNVQKWEFRTVKKIFKMALFLFSQEPKLPKNLYKNLNGKLGLTKADPAWCNIEQASLLLPAFPLLSAPPPLLFFVMFLLYLF
jgi:hypothetical protein